MRTAITATIVFFLFNSFQINYSAGSSLVKDTPIKKVDTPNCVYVLTDHFENFTLMQNTQGIFSKGYGIIKARVLITCEMAFVVLKTHLEGSTYSGTDEIKIVNYILRTSKKIKIGGKTVGCPETNEITIQMLDPKTMKARPGRRY